MKITILGPAHPYRGGLASIMQTMARLYQRDGHEVDLCTFTLQYPSLLFPGKSQTVTTPAPEDLTIRREVSTINPFNWWRVGAAGRHIRTPGTGSRAPQKTDNNQLIYKQYEEYHMFYSFPKRGTSKSYRC